jgi:Protein of unknown function (DUF2946)
MPRVLASVNRNRSTRSPSGAVDEIVARSLAKWPNVPAVFGWLSLDRRGNWLIKGEKIANTALREFIARNYEADEKGRWYFQNGPQRVFVSLAYTPLVVHYEGEDLSDQCGRRFAPSQTFQDDEGSVLIAGNRTVALLDDRDLARFADDGQTLKLIARADVPGRFGFMPEPKPG